MACLEGGAAEGETALYVNERHGCGALGLCVQNADDAECFGGWWHRRCLRRRTVHQQLLQGNAQNVGRAHQYRQARIGLALTAFEVLHPPLRLAHEAAEVRLSEAPSLAPVRDAATDTTSLHGVPPVEGTHFACPPPLYPALRCGDA